MLRQSILKSSGISLQSTVLGAALGSSEAPEGRNNVAHSVSYGFKVLNPPTAPLSRRLRKGDRREGVGTMNPRLAPWPTVSRPLRGLKSLTILVPIRLCQVP